MQSTHMRWGSHDRLAPIEFALAANGVLHDATPEVGAIEIDELATKLEQHDDFLLVMAMDRRRFEAAHIAGSVDLETFIEMSGTLAADTPVVVYCTDPACAASRVGAAMIAEAGFTNVRRFAGGLSSWVAAGHEIEPALASVA